MIRSKYSLVFYLLAGIVWRFTKRLTSLYMPEKCLCFCQKYIKTSQKPSQKYAKNRFFFHKSISFCAVFTLSFIYRVAIRPWLSGGCRFYPTCSAYGIQAFQQHSLPRALYLILRRIARCHPWGPCACDPVPPSLFSSRS